MRDPIASQVASVVNCRSRERVRACSKYQARTCGGNTRHRCRFRRSSSSLGDWQRANESLPHADPHDGPSVGLPSTCEVCRNLPVSPLNRRHPISEQPAPGRPTVSASEGERRPLRPEVGPQHPVGVGPCGGVAPPRWSGSSRPPCIRRTTTTDHSRAGHRGDSVQFRRCPFSHTPRCPRFFAVSLTKSTAAALSLGRPSGRLTRGERRPLQSETSTRAWSTFVPCGDVAPPSQQFVVGDRTARPQEFAGARGASAHAARL
jgi:hypothetical protein